MIISLLKTFKLQDIPNSIRKYLINVVAIEQLFNRAYNTFEWICEFRMPMYIMQADNMCIYFFHMDIRHNI